MSAPSWDAVLGYHMNPQTCGVAKFNLRLARELGVPCRPLAGDIESRYPLISIKTTEMDDGWYHHLPLWTPFDLLLHDRPGITEPLGRARRVFYADQLGCPSTLDAKPVHRPGPRILLFGMAHKVNGNRPYWEKLRDLLGHTYTISVSTAIHEGTPWDGTFQQTREALADVFGDDHLRMLGYLADDALVQQFASTDAVALFFDPAARANNTSLWAAMSHGVPVLTNLDAQSPRELIHRHSVLDIDVLSSWPFAHVLSDVGMRGRAVAEQRSWATLVEALRAA